MRKEIHDMNIIELEPTRVNAINNWWMKPEAGDLIACLEKAAQKATQEYAELSVKAIAEDGNPNYEQPAKEKLMQAAEFQTAVKVLKSFFPDGPFIARIEL